MKEVLILNFRDLRYYRREIIGMYMLMFEKCCDLGLKKGKNYYKWFFYGFSLRKRENLYYNWCYW